MLRVAIYARYSSDMQSAFSIEDQFRICRDQAAREKWKVAGTYKDAAISGASVTLRPGIQALLQDAQAGKFEAVLAEALDRISRDQADIATLYKHFKFAGVALVTLAEGEISELHVGLKGTMNALFLKDLAAKTHRGLRGRVEKGKSGGGLCYGYKVVKRLDNDGEQVTGERTINEAEAEIVRRIFREFAAGKSPKAIAADLNRGGIPGPHGRVWGDTTIRGHVCRGTGIVNNELYAGMLVWNRLRYVKNPTTGKRVSRVNPKSEWIRIEVPELRIVDDGLWRAARRRQEAIAKKYENTTKGVCAYRAKKLNTLRRPAFLFSGLIKCGCCGGDYGIITRDRYGCLNRYRRGTCDNGRTIHREKIEQRILSGLTGKLVSADAVAEAVRAYAEALNSQNRERRAQAEIDRKALEKIERGIAGIMAAIEDGMYQSTMKARMDELERQKADILARMKEFPTDVPDIHPNIAEIYKRRVERLTRALDDPELRLEACDAIRSLVGEVILTPGKKHGEVNAILRGELMGILDIVSPARDETWPNVITNGASGPRNQLYLLKALSPQGGGLFAGMGEAQDACQSALQVQGQALRVAGVRGQDNPLYQTADNLRRFAAAGIIIQRLGQFRHLLAVKLAHVGVNINLGFLGIGDQGLKLGFAALQRPHAVLDLLGGHALADGVHQLVQVRVRPLKFGLIAVQGGIAVGAKRVHVPGVFLGKDGAQLRVHEVMLKAVKNGVFQDVPADGAQVGAGALVARR